MRPRHYPVPQPTIVSPGLRAVDVQVYTICEYLTAGLIYFMVVFSPWAFGATQPWSIWTMNVSGYAAGSLLFMKWFIRRKGYLPPCWVSLSSAAGSSALISRRLKQTLGCLTLLILGFCVISATNSAATQDPAALTFTYHRHLNWLPHSFDSRRTWLAFFNYAALACTFWAIVDWLPGKSAGEERATRQQSLSKGSTPLIPTRLRRLLWILCLNGALVGVEGIIQRLEGSGRLLFLIKPAINSEALSQFGPYHYRANASAYFNLIWPVCLAFWWTLHRAADSRQRKHHLLLLCGLIMAACPIISTSRAGALITFSLIVLSAFFLCVTQLLATERRNREPKRKFTFRFLLFFFAGTLALGLLLGWKALKPRLGQIQEGFVGREEMYDAARPMARDYPFFGTGPGTFESVFQLYRISTETYWPAQLHNDWLETRITFGMIGSALIFLAFVTVLVRWFAANGLHGGRRFMVLLWLAMGSALIHARFDFPFQIYSILFLFLVLCAIAFNLSRR